VLSGTGSLCYPFFVKLKVELEREDDGRWIAEVVDLPGVMAYGKEPDQAIRAARALALRVLADKIEHGELDAQVNSVEFLLPQPSTAA
jgi:predicted RNase H-like HicB family nuclease